MINYPRIILLFLASTISAVILLPSLLASEYLTVISHHFCSGICHQELNKSFVINGVMMPVCARCFGIYSGALIASIVSLLFKKFFPDKFGIFIILLIPMVIDVLFTTTGLYTYQKSIAFFTGSLFGYSAFYYILSGFEKLFSEFRNGEKIE